ncbi:MAG: GNAT family N-acetyltransferase [Candidatus Aenigmarchaeota archaeon]
MIIRNFRPEDMPQIEKLVAGAEGFGPGSVDYTRTNILNTEKLGNAQTFVAEKGGKVVGFCDCWIWSEALEMENLIVGKAHREKGIGTAIIGHAEQWARKFGCNSFILFTPNTIKSTPFYVKIGFRFSGFTMNEEGKGTESLYFWREIR